MPKATAVVKELLRYPSHSTSINAKRAEKEQLLIDLKAKLSAGSVKGTTEYFVTLPLASMHNHRLIGTARRMHPKLREKVYELVQDGVTNICVIKKCLKKYVKDAYKHDIVKPCFTDRAYYPLNKDIINCVHSAICAGKHSQLDLIQLEKLIDDWKAKGSSEREQTKFFFRKCTDDVTYQQDVPATVLEPFVGDGFADESDTEDDTEEEQDLRSEVCDVSSVSGSSTFLFVHQEPWQQRMITKYGNTLCLLDATYKTTKYALPLFLLCVRTNSGYVPVAEFIIEHETAVLIAEALKIISSWNSQWNPPYFMIDYSEAELNAIQSVFQETEVYLCEFHREQAWTRWIRNGKNNLVKDDQENLLALLRQMAYADTIKLHEEKLDDLLQSEVYKNHSNVQRYLQRKWLVCTTRWCDSFRKPGFHASVKTNNGVEALNKLFKTYYNNLRTDKSLSGLCELIVCSFLPDAIQKYTVANVKYSTDFKLYDPTIPQYLHNRPHYFVKHCMQRLHAAISNYSSSDVIKKEESFLVKSAVSDDDQDWYKVQLSSSNTFPKCECRDYERYYLPCKHFFAVFLFVPGYSWDSLPQYFRESPFINIDTSVFSSEKEQEITYASTDSGSSTTKHGSYNVCMSTLSEDCTDVLVDTSSVVCSTSSLREDGRKFSVQALSQTMRSNLQILVDFSYTCTNHSSLEEVNHKIENVINLCKSRLPASESGLTLNPPPVKRRKLCDPSVIKTKTSRIRSLPVYKKKKKLCLFDKYKKRVGAFADVVKAAAEVSILIEGCKEKKQALHSTQNKRKYRRVLEKARKLQALKKKKVIKAKEENQECSSDLQLQVTQEYMLTTVDPYKRRKLTDDDFSTILSTHSHKNWLNDNIINYTQNILRTVFQVPGLYDTSLGPYLTYPRADSFYQILHDTSHWILISTVGCPPSHVKVFDSVYSGKVSQYIQKQTAAIMRTNAWEIVFLVQSVQQQPNGNDCGAFSIAFLVELLFGGEPTNVVFDVSKLRHHLHKCLKNGEFDVSFPKLSSQTVHILPSGPLTISIPVFCVCRMPYFREDRDKECLHMAECDRCHNWFHRNCTKIPDSVFTKKSQFWICSRC